MSEVRRALRAASAAASARKEAHDYYRNNNEGFCYINWYKGAQSGIMFVITLPTFVAGIYLFVRVLMSGNWPNKVRCVPALDPGTSSGLSRP